MITPAAADPDLQRAMALHRQGQLAQAVGFYRSALVRQPGHLDALQMLGLALNGLGQPEAALQQFELALRVAPGHAGVQFNRGLVLLQLQRTPAALEAFDGVLRADPRHAKAHWMRATALRGLDRLDDALSSLATAATLWPQPEALWVERGAWLYQAGRFAEALEAFEQVLQKQPAQLDALINAGSTLIRLGRPEEAARVLERAVAAHPQAADAHYNLGLALARAGRGTEAIRRYDEALRLAPGLAEAWLNRGVARQQQNDAAAAIADFRQVLALQPGHADAMSNLASALADAGELAEADLLYQQLLQASPTRELTVDALLHTRMRHCDWTDFTLLRERVERAVASGVLVTPARLFPASGDPQLQKACAERYAQAKFPPRREVPAFAAARAGERIRVGYFSSDFHGHATAFLMARLFELHDRGRFEVTAFCLGAPPEDAMRRRLRAAFEHFVDLAGLADQAAVEAARARRLDIAIDLKGLSQGARPQLFAERVAPVQIGYLGYPNTMGSPAFDYLVADATLVPPGHRAHYSERILALPHSYQANDDTRALMPPMGGREDAGLPAGGFVFCSFNNPYKITPEVFDVWMRLLARVPGSVLWQFAGHAGAMRNLHEAARSRGVDPARLVFARPVKPDDHLARHALADLFLDTAPCNAHTTASDALWAGLPLLTLQGETFAGRVAASLLHAVGLPELVTHSLPAYEAKAFELATRPGELQALRERLAVSRGTQPLFDSQRFTRGFERGLRLVHERRLAGLPPDHVDVPAH
ncbi:tetratricopeptide repeat protein [Caenimonas sedimenti]|uniref:protein O-GlcNAc transferase n=1 Tax=Caenimonas sedimenti TaxID=2596921 RepID=A0A562ZW02_9BURK|nr:tetratricopeptide repeat protein [Caenimonas sedimenti]TWO72498.1 tetratricopeptide repeat protein [Caenimonas sedimenti]